MTFRTEGRWKAGRLFLVVLTQNGTVLFSRRRSAGRDQGRDRVEDERSASPTHGREDTATAYNPEASCSLS